MWRFHYCVAIYKDRPAHHEADPMIRHAGAGVLRWQPARLLHS